MQTRSIPLLPVAIAAQYEIFSRRKILEEYTEQAVEKETLHTRQPFMAHGRPVS